MPKDRQNHLAYLLPHVPPFPQYILYNEISKHISVYCEGFFSLNKTTEVGDAIANLKRRQEGNETIHFNFPFLARRKASPSPYKFLSF